MIGTVTGFHFKPEYRDKRICLEADWLIRVEWDDDRIVENNLIHPDWLDIIHNNS